MGDDSSIRNHVVIAGTGRTGTSFLVQLLTHLGLDTGFTPDNLPMHEHARAGLESDIRDEHAPYIVKNPSLHTYLDEVLSSGNIVIEHAIIPMRALEHAAASRRKVQNATIDAMPPIKRFTHKIGLKKGTYAGGLITRNDRELEDVLLKNFYSLIIELSKHHIPITFIHYPTHIENADYLYQKLTPILGGISQNDFNRVHKQVARKDMVSSF